MSTFVPSWLGFQRVPWSLLNWSIFTLALLLISSPSPELSGAEAEPQPPAARGIQLFEKHDFAGAVAAFESILQSHPTNLQALTYLGRIAFEENRLEDAVGFFEKASTAAPQDSMTFHWLGRAYGIQARELGPPRGIGPARRTKKSLERAVQLDPDNLEARVDLATFYREAPFIVGGSKRAAMAQVEEINRRDPYLGALVQGDAALTDKKFAEAERHYQAAVQRQKGQADGYYRLGLLYQRWGRYPDAFTAFNKVLQIDPKEQRAYYQIGKTADLSGQRLDEGEVALKKYLQCQPFFVMPKLSAAHRRLGNIYLKTGQKAAAREQYSAALRAAPEDKEAGTALNDLGAADPR